MSNRRSSRRTFIRHAAVGAGALLAGPHFLNAAVAAEEKTSLHVACNQYPWTVFYRRDGNNFNSNLDAGLAEVKASGLDGFEPILTSLGDLERLKPLLAKHGLGMRSFYMNVPLHEAAAQDESIETVVTIAKAAKAVGTRIVVINPQPLSWAEDVPKTDAQLRAQSDGMNRLGAALREAGLTLAYHYHTPAMRHAAREFHHMMNGTEPENMSLCFDTHWTYRGADDSEVAVFDVAKLYGDRVAEVHLRQSKGGVWTEAMGDGDIDYARLAEFFTQRGRKPHVVLEQACEGATPKTMSTLDAFKASAEYTRKTFADWA